MYSSIDYLRQMCETIKNLRESETNLIDTTMNHDPNNDYDTIRTHSYCRAIIERMSNHVYMKHNPDDNEHVQLLENYNIQKLERYFIYS